jgi:hypothetical protein
MVEQNQDTSSYELMHKEYLTPEETSELFQIGLDVVRQAAFRGDLAAEIVNHDIVRMRRRDVLAWLEARDAGRA